jgi:catechol 2,3-dioxygenase-like lactoylglutathione lyase family enzyme
MITRLDHVQLLIPAGGQEPARAFYAGVLGMNEETVPEPFAKVGGLWFRSGGAVFHLAVQDPFTAARKAHPAFCVRSLEEAAARLSRAGCEMLPDNQIPDRRRLFTRDPFGNRIELIQDGDGFTQKL